MRFFILITTLISLAFGAPALNILRDFKQADGTTFEARAFGNQHLNWIESSDGEILKYSQKSKNFEYATIKDNQLKASGVRYDKQNSLRARSIGQINKLNVEDVYKLWQEKQQDSNQKRHQH